MTEFDIEVLPHLEQCEMLSQNDVPEAHLKAFQYNQCTPYNIWGETYAVPMINGGVIVSREHIMCMGAVTIGVSQDGEYFHFRHCIPDVEPVSTAFVDTIGTFGPDAIKKVIIIRQGSNYLIDEPDEEFIKDQTTDTHTFTIGYIEPLKHDGIDVETIMIRLPYGSQEFTLTVGEGKIVAWDQLSQLPVKVIDLLES